MSAHRCRWPVTALVVGLLSLVMSGCVVPGGGYGYHGNPGYGLGYYQPSGTSYGGWGHGYDVGPVRRGAGYEQHGGAGYQQHGGAGHEQHGGAGYQQHGGHGGPAGRPVPPLPGGERQRGGA
ncbi:MAG: hypothetical protein ACREFJ_05085 [Acetobacteraceae bacterium]